MKKIVLLMASMALMIGLTACSSKMVEKPVEKHQISTSMICETPTNDATLIADKVYHYKSLFNANGLKLYGNTINVSSDGKYTKVFADEIASIEEVAPLSTGMNGEINIEVYKFKKSEKEIDKYVKLQIVKDDKMKEIWLQYDKDKKRELYDITEDIEKFKEMINKVQIYMTVANWDIQYVNTTENGIDTIKIVDQSGKEIGTLCIDQKTAEVHMLSLVGGANILSSDKDCVATFTYTDSSTIEKPSDTAKGRFVIMYYAFRYLGLQHIR